MYCPGASKRLCTGTVPDLASSSQLSHAKRLGVRGAQLSSVVPTNIAFDSHSFDSGYTHGSNFVPGRLSKTELREFYKDDEQREQVPIQQWMSSDESKLLTCRIQRFQTIKPLLKIFKLKATQLNSFHLSAIASRCAHISTKETLPASHKLVSLLLGHCRPRLSSLDARCIANTFWAAASIHHRIPHEVLGAFMHEILIKAHSFSPQEVSNIAWGVATLSLHTPQNNHLPLPTKPSPAITDWLTRFITITSFQLPSMSIRNLSNLFWALTTLHVPVTPRTLTLLTSTTLRLLPVASPQDLTTILWCFSHYPHPLPPAWVHAYFASASSQLHLYHPQDLSITLYSCAALSLLPPPAFLTSYTTAAARILPQMGPQALSTLLCAAARLHTLTQTHRIPYAPQHTDPHPTTQQAGPNQPLESDMPSPTTQPLTASTPPTATSTPPHPNPRTTHSSRPLIHISPTSPNNLSHAAPRNTSTTASYHTAESAASPTYLPPDPHPHNLNIQTPCITPWDPPFTSHLLHHAILPALPSFPPHSLSCLTNTLPKLPPNLIPPTLSLLLATLPLALPRMSPRQLTCTLSGLASLPPNLRPIQLPSIPPLLPSTLAALPPSHLPVLLWSLARLQLPLPPAAQAPLLSALPSALPTLTPQGLSLLLWSFPRLSLRPSPSILSAIESEFVFNLHAAKPQEMALVWCSFGRLGWQPTESAVQSFYSHCTLKATAMSPRDVSMIMWTSASLRLHIPPACSNALWSIINPCSPHPPSTPNPPITTPTTANPPAAAAAANPARWLPMILWSAGVMSTPPPHRYADQLLLSVQARLATLAALELSAVLWALAKLQLFPGTSWLQQALAAFSLQLPSASALALTNFLWALSRFGQAPPPQFLRRFEHRAQAVGSFSAFQCHTLDWSMQQLGLQPLLLPCCAIDYSLPPASRNTAQS